MKAIYSFTFLISFVAYSAIADTSTYSLVLKDHKFTPETLEVPSNSAFVLVVENQDKTPEEFDSEDLKREKIILGGKKGEIKIAALQPGEYEFVGEFHEKTAKGKIIVR